MPVQPSRTRPACLSKESLKKQISRRSLLYPTRKLAQ